MEPMSGVRATILSGSDYKVMPWKNGLGETMQLAIRPAGADFGALKFDWRLSIAKVGQDGPFSAFPGFDRKIMVIEGNGMNLSIERPNAPGRVETVSLAHRFEPLEFSGEWTVSGTLIDGPIRDFNLMVRREWAQSSPIRVVILDQDNKILHEQCPVSGGILIVVCLGESMEVKSSSWSRQLGFQETLLLEADLVTETNSFPLELKYVGKKPSSVAIMRIQPI